MEIILKNSLKEADLSLFPNSIDYNKAFIAVEEHLNKHVHKDVVIGASIVDGGMLNDHGIEHIQMVIERAGQLLMSKSNDPLSPYEIFMLLCAIHVHDVGNMMGRAGHEKNNGTIAKQLMPFLDNNQFEIETFRRIAEAHGGKINGSKDKLSALKEYEEVNSKTIRFRALAAMLKFADELADGRARGNQDFLESGKLPKGSEVYHKYSLSLDSVIIRPDEKSIKLKFFLKLDDINRTWGKQVKDGVENVFLLDEIYQRTLKMHLERVYCCRYTRGLMEIDEISVEIEIYGDSEDDGGMPLLEKIEYRLKETGYPGECEIFEISNIDQNKHISGENLFEKYNEKGS